MTCLINFLFLFHYLFVLIHSKTFYSGNNEQQKSYIFQINKGLSLNYEIQNYGADFYVNLTLTNQSKIIDYDIYREKFPIKNVLFTNYSSSYFIMSLIMNYYFEGDFAGFYLISMNDVNSIKV